MCAASQSLVRTSRDESGPMKKSHLEESRGSRKLEHTNVKTQKTGGKTQKTTAFPLIYYKHLTQCVDYLVNLQRKLKNYPFIRVFRAVCTVEVGQTVAALTYYFLHLASEAEIVHFCLLPPGKRDARVWSSQTVNWVFLKGS